jgi:hypothetical protein
MAAPGILRAAGALAALLLALCAGAVWSVVALFFRGDAPWMAAPAALLILHALGYLKLTHRAARIAAALALYLATIAYAHYLNGASIVSSQLGVGFGDALTALGPEMAWALAITRGTALDVAILAAIGLALAFIAGRGR